MPDNDFRVIDDESDAIVMDDPFDADSESLRARRFVAQFEEVTGCGFAAAMFVLAILAVGFGTGFPPQPMKWPDDTVRGACRDGGGCCNGCCT